MKKRIFSAISAVIFMLGVLSSFAFAASVDITDAASYKAENLSGNNLQFSAKITGAAGITFNVSAKALKSFYYDSDIRYYTFTFNNLTVRTDKNNFYDFDLKNVGFSLTNNSFAVKYTYKDSTTKTVTETALEMRYTVTGKFNSHTVAIMNGKTLNCKESLLGKLVFETSDTGKFSTKTFQFTDVKDSKAWYYTYVNQAGAYGIVNGVGDGKFEPSRNIKRSELATLIVEATKHIVTYKTNSSISFTDVPKNAWYHDYVNKCANMGLMKGVGGGRFDPDATATRQEIAVVAANFVKLIGSYNGKALPSINEKTLNSELAKLYKDSGSIASWARGAVLTCYKLEIMKGDSGSFFPKRTLTRAEGAKIFNDIYFKAVKG
ncbi:MAG: S-layer homology domain-containing protein [Clostridia bacterium]|nr:S-layer homology domain-containing protein [Clostridia bacterium]